MNLFSLLDSKSKRLTTNRKCPQATNSTMLKRYEKMMEHKGRIPK
ncbi:MAG TPA: hypothetical protein VEY70_25435 [Metabacillus sp.]|nr:hypothetical protein [Metabacillus sp.]